ncbi:MAG: hypothetical protein WBW81_10495 [Methylocella sp.]
MTMQTDVQGVLDQIKTAQQKPLGDPRFQNLSGLGKAGTFSESASATSGLTFYDLELGAKFSLSGTDAIAQHDSPGFGQRRHPGGMASDHRDQYHRLTVRRFFGKSRRGNGGRHA